MKDGLINVHMPTISPQTLEEWARIYCDIWRESPWNEDFWRPEKVTEDFRTHMAKPDAVALLSLVDGVVAGFTMGYAITAEELRIIASNTLLDDIFKKHPRAFYVAELGVVANYRGRRISLALTSELLRTVRERGLPIVVLRTDIKAYAARHVYEKLGFIELDIHDSAHTNRTYWVLEVPHE